MTHLQTAVRQLVNTNVILKEHLDKQTEDKKAARKKLMQMEKIQADKDRFIAKKELEMKEMSERLKTLENQYKAKVDEVKLLKELSNSLNCSKDSSKSKHMIWQKFFFELLHQNDRTYLFTLILIKVTKAELLKTAFEQNVQEFRS
jgi:hypothetical protein